MIYSLQAGSEKECNISRVEYHAHMHLTCDSEMLHLLPLSPSPPHSPFEFGLALFEQHKIKDEGWGLGNQM